MIEKLVFNDAMGGLIQAVRVEISPKCRERMKTAGFDSEAKLLPAYPAELWAGVVKILGEEIYPGHAAAEGHRRLAIRTVEAFAKTRPTAKKWSTPPCCFTRFAASTE